MNTVCTNAPCEEVGPFLYCPIKGCEWVEPTPEVAPVINGWLSVIQALRDILPVAEAELVHLPYIGNSQIHDRVKEVRQWLRDYDANGQTRITTVTLSSLDVAWQEWQSRPVGQHDDVFMDRLEHTVSRILEYLTDQR